MKIDLSAVILDLDKKPIKDGEKDFTLATACCNALLTPDQKEGEVSGEEKVKRFRLAEKVYDGGEQDLSVDDIALLKKLIGKIYPPLVVGRTYELLDPPPAKLKAV